jgi:phosphoribosyl 1,2-cyclic phosphate phosphodiesterase
MNSHIKVTFLGTGTSQGIPIIGSNHPVCKSENLKDKRLRVSILIEWENISLVIDCGPDFRQQMLRENVTKIDGVLLTHEHNDHIAGIDDIRPFYFKQGNIPFYAEKRVFEALKKRFEYIFETENKYPGAPSIEQYVIDKDSELDLFGNIITPIQAMHGSLPVLGYRIGDFTYLTDIKTITPEELEKVKGTNTLVISELRKEEHHSHLNIKEALELIKIIQPKQTYFTHISHQLGFHDEVEAQLPENVHLAYDTLKISV